jgi:hypothetical protein
MDVRRIFRVARVAIERSIRFASGLAFRWSASERAIDQIASEQQSYFRRTRVPDRADGPR